MAQYIRNETDAPTEVLPGHLLNLGGFEHERTDPADPTGIDVEQIQALAASALQEPLGAAGIELVAVELDPTAYSYSAWEPANYAENDDLAQGKFHYDYRGTIHLRIRLSGTAAGVGYWLQQLDGQTGTHCAPAGFQGPTGYPVFDDIVVAVTSMMADEVTRRLRAVTEEQGIISYQNTVSWESFTGRLETVGLDCFDYGVECLYDYSTVAAMLLLHLREELVLRRCR